MAGEQKDSDINILLAEDSPNMPDREAQALGDKPAEPAEPTEEAGGTGQRETTSGKILLRVAYLPISDHLILGVLKHLIETEEVTPECFELETQCLAGGNAVAEALEEGRADAALVLAPIAMDLFNNGVPIKLILFAHKNGGMAVRSRQGEFRQPYMNFFKGKSFLIPHQMSPQHMLAHMFFKKIGLKPSMERTRDDGVSFEVAAPLEMPGHLRDNPDYSGFMAPEPMGTRAIASGLAQEQFHSSELWTNHPCCVVTIRDDFINEYDEAVYELTELLVEAGKLIDSKPEKITEMAVSFLDPDKTLGLERPLLRNILREPKGIKTGDLFPVIEDLDKMQQYMVNQMGIGSLIDLEKFVDTRYADSACAGGTVENRRSSLHDTPAVALGLLQRGTEKELADDKADSDVAGKYLSFVLGQQEFGINIQKIKEIIGMMPIRSVPKAPAFVKGVIKLREKVIPVIDLGMQFGIDVDVTSARSCIIVLELDLNQGTILMGITAESVSEVLNIKTADIDAAPYFSTDADTDHILGMAKLDGGVKILLNIEQVLDMEQKLEASKSVISTEQPGPSAGASADT